eukprot:599922-Prorocentrum_lima.AAC.1
MPNIGQIDRVGLHQRLHLIVVRGRDPRDTLLQTKTIDPVRPSHASIDLEHQHIRSADDALTMLAFPDSWNELLRPITIDGVIAWFRVSRFAFRVSRFAFRVPRGTGLGIISRFAPPATKASAACWRAPGDISQPRIFPGRRT